MKKKPNRQGIDSQVPRTAFPGRRSSMLYLGQGKMFAVMAVFGFDDKEVPFRYLCIHRDASDPEAHLQPFILICISQTTC